MNVRIVFPTKTLIYISILGFSACSSCKNDLVIKEYGGALGKTNAPVLVEVRLKKYQAVAALVKNKNKDFPTVGQFD